MKRLLYFSALLVALGAMSFEQTQAQGILNKIKQKTEDKVVNSLFGEDDKNNQVNDNSPAGNSSQNGSSMSNTKGGGLNASAPDVKQNISDAGRAYESKKYSDARYAVRQAILGVEMEIGKNILNDLPEKIAGLPAEKSEDNVTSSGIGFVGMVISRVYRNNDMEFRVTVGNDAAMLSAANAYLASGAYGSSSGQDYKSITFQDERGVISWDEYSGYSLSVPFGQSSVFVAEGVNFANEDDFMSAANEVNLSSVKEQLGEK